jgi:NAD(P)H-dependent FMN reductase
MQLLVISGSHRRKSQSAKVANHLARRATDLSLFTAAEVLDLAHQELPFWDEDVWDASNAQWKATLAPVNDKLSAASAYVIVSPEWHGMVPSKLKNLLLFGNTAVMGHKPALITAVSSGRGGAYPVNELRTSGYKNTRICYVPEHLIVRHAEDVLNGDDGAVDDKEDAYIRGRIDFALAGLAEYARAMATMNRDILINKDYRNGM